MKHSLAFEQFTRMREQLKRIEQQITKSQQLLSHDITIDNKSREDLKFTIKLEDSATREAIDVCSRISVPNHTSITHKIDELVSFEKNFNDSIQNQLQSNRKRQQLEDTNYQEQLSISRDYEQRLKISATRQEQKFQPITPLRNNNDEGPPLQRKLDFQDQILVDDNDESQSEIRSNERILRLTDSKYVNNPQMSARKGEEEPEREESGSNTMRIEQQGTIPISLPLSMENKMHQYGVPSQDPEKYEDADLAKKEQLNWSMHTLERSSIKMPNESLSTHWKIEKTSPRTKRISPHIDYYQKTYTQRSREKQIFERKEKQSKEKRGDSQYKSAGISIVGKEQKKTQSKVADDLFQRRKNECLKKIDRQRNYINSIRKGSRERSISSKTIVKEVKREPLIARDRQLAMSPRIEQIGNRLHLSKSKSPCQHHNRFNEQHLRQTFNMLVKQNPLVQRYVVHKERQQLFQRLRKQGESVSLWPMKMVNYTFCKLRKLSSYYQGSD